jgi:hypothetical protein
LTAINFYISGLPINISYSPTTAQQLSTETSFLYRPNLVGTPVLGKSSQTPVAGQPGQYQYLDPAAVTIPAAANTPYGNCPRNVARAPNYNDLDLGVHKRFSLGFEKVGLEFRAEAFDVFNHANAQTASQPTPATVSSLLTFPAAKSN